MKRSRALRSPTEFAMLNRFDVVAKERTEVILLEIWHFVALRIG
jgi:hypothetical protein